MVVFHIDLDNTLIYSYRHDIGQDKIPVELYQGREISFVTTNTYAKLRKLKEDLLVVPTSTRTVEQYRRIDLKIGAIPYALVCNGGRLLKDGVDDLQWYQSSRELISESEAELVHARKLLEKEQRRSFELRFIDELFLFTKCNSPEYVVESLRQELDGSVVQVFHQGEKVYVVPNNLSKGMAVQRFRGLMGAEKVIAAGDSGFDIPMLAEADLAIAPSGFCQKYHIPFPVAEMAGKGVFSDELLDKVCHLS